MDWMTVITAAALLFAGFALFRLWRQKKEIYAFTELLEENLDALLTGKPLKKDQETKDTLAGKVNEKLARIQHIQERKAKESLEAKEQMKELISDISHQTRTPIANQKIYLEILRQQELPREVYGFLDKLEHQTDKLDFLFQSLVKMSRLETGILELSPADGEIAPMIRETAASLQKRAEAKNICLDCELEERVICRFDRKWTSEALGNIIDNAVKYSPEESRITIRIRKYEFYACIEVEDQGPGIAEEERAQIFGRFYRCSGNYQAEGVGIGLYLTQQIAEKQGGYVKVKSVPKKGSAFSLFLPRS